MNALRMGIVLLASGRSERFGSNKLLADFGGRPMICCALEAMQEISAEKRCLVTGSDAVASFGRLYGCDVIWNEHAELGQAHSVCLGVGAMKDMDAVLLMVGDQPRLTGRSLSRLMQAFSASSKGIACLQDETHMGNPAVFAKTYFSDLLALSGDRGAKGILRAYADDLLVVSCLHPGELADADTPCALASILQRI